MALCIVCAASLAARPILRYTAAMNALEPRPEHRRAIANWLLLCLILVALMVFIGGVTRLTESGLSIVEWKLVSGTLPPMNEAAWQSEFAEYQATPQFKQVNSNFTVDDFKKIYWLEYIHRLLGRIIGLAVALPLAYFAIRRQLTRTLLWRGTTIALLIAAQGAVGWIMVASGLEHQPRVEPIKLAAHLLLAFFVFLLMLWTRWQVLGRPRTTASPCFARAARATLILLFIQIFFGALVAGLRAGLTYNTYPLMDGSFIPDGLHLLQPWWLNHLESALTVQFQHRMGAVAVAIATIALVLHGWKHAHAKRSLRLLLVATLSQFALGIATLLASVPIALASAHQFLALILAGLLLHVIYHAQIDPNQHPQKISP